MTRVIVNDGGSNEMVIVMLIQIQTAIPLKLNYIWALQKPPDVS